MKVGVLGGTFDPPHRGHLHVARVAQRALGLDRVLFLPCHRQPLKGSRPVASPFHRAAMVALAVASHPSWLLDPLELDRGGLSYTVDTLEALREAAPGDSIFLLMGEDGLESFVRWHRFRDILALARLAVVPRRSEDRPDGPRSHPDVPAVRLPSRLVPVSSTQIRALRAQGRPIEGLVPAAVASYIVRQDLYAGGLPARSEGGRGEG